jgi:hypothetical protein
MIRRRGGICRVIRWCWWMGRVCMGMRCRARCGIRIRRGEHTARDQARCNVRRSMGFPVGPECNHPLRVCVAAENFNPSDITNLTPPTMGEQPCESCSKKPPEITVGPDGEIYPKPPQPTGTEVGVPPPLPTPPPEDPWWVRLLRLLMGDGQV